MPLTTKTHRLNMRKHRNQVENAVPAIDNEAPKFYNVEYLFPHSHIKVHVKRVKEILLDNMQLVKDINMRYRSDFQCWVFKKRKPSSLVEYYKSKKKIARENKKYFEIIKSSKTKYPNKESEENWREFVRKFPSLKLENRNNNLRTSILPKHVMGCPSKRQKCFIDISIDGFRIGRLEIELYNDIVPQAASKFISFCDVCDYKTLKNSTFFQIFKDLFCVGGNILNNTATGRKGVYGENFPNENNILAFNGPGVVALYSTDKNFLSSSQFLITFKKLPYLNKQFLVIGRVLHSYSVLETIESCGSRTGKPLNKVVISDCAIIKKETY